jgi:ubiquinone/menaquinone biosynthesis C-methylase UbiE
MRRRYRWRDSSPFSVERSGQLKFGPRQVADLSKSVVGRIVLPQDPSYNSDRESFMSAFHLVDEFRAFERSAALRTAVELDLFTQIGAGSRTVRTLAKAIGASERGIRILCDYLSVAGHLVKRSERYSLSRRSARFLVMASPAYIGSPVRFLASDANLRSFAALTEAVRMGVALPAARTLADTSAWVAFARFMADVARPVADAAAAALDLDRGRPIRVLDVAAGHGLYGLAVAARHRSARIVALDAPEVLEIAAHYARLAGVAERYELIPGDAFRVRFRGPYDLIVMANFAHHFDSETNVALFKKCLAALAPSGCLALIEFVPNDDRVSPAADAAFALTMLATTPRGNAYTRREWVRMLRDGGFDRVRQPAMGDVPKWLITARPRRRS